MVAVFHPETLLPKTLLPEIRLPESVRPERTNRNVVRPRAAGERPHLRVIQGGAGAAADTNETTLRALVAVGVLLLGGFVGLRMVRASGLAAAGSAEPAAATQFVNPAGVSESVYVVQPGDSLWSIATALLPGQDPRPLVDELARRNGGSTIAAGQRLIVPAN